MELTVDKCVLVHCDSAAADAEHYRAGGLAFLDHWQKKTELVACINAGIRKEYLSFSPAGIQWWRSVITQSRYRQKKRRIAHPQREDFCRKKDVRMHGEDFEYVDAASQSDSLLWLSNEITWQNGEYRRRIRGEFKVKIQNVNEYMNEIAGEGVAAAS